MNAYKITYCGGDAEIVEKKSRFIATVAPVTSESEALDFIAATKKKYWDARHNCSAFVIGEKHELQRCSDDGEPGGTAGRPMLDVLLGEDVHDTVVVVTRYFGGTLLGTGGLVRAYSKAVQEGLRNSQIITKQQGYLLGIETDYGDIGKIQYILGQRNLAITNSDYTDKVTLDTLVPADELDSLKNELTEGTNGRIDYKECLLVCFSFIDGAAHIFS